MSETPINELISKTNKEAIEYFYSVLVEKETQQTKDDSKETK